MSCRSILLALAIITVALPAVAQTWKPLAPMAPYVHRLKVFSDPDLLVACGDSMAPFNEYQASSMEFYHGGGMRISTNDGASWSDVKLAGFSVRDVMRLPNAPNIWIASVVTPFVFTGGIVRSDDGGATWTTVPENDFVRIEQFLVRPYDPPMVLTAQVNTVVGFQTSVDSCRSFQEPSNPSVQTRSIAISSNDTSLVFMAGDGRGEPGVFRSRNNGQLWEKDSAGLEGKRVLCVQPSRFFSNVVYCGTDSVVGQTSVGTGIYKSNDTGRTWFFCKGTEGMRVWSIVENPVYGNLLMAAADSAGVIASGNWGDGWEVRSDGMPSGVVVRTIEIVRERLDSGRIAAYAGTYGHGVYKSVQITTDVEEATTVSTVSVVPQPAHDVASVTFAGVVQATIDVVDLHGTIVYTAPVTVGTTSSIALLPTASFAPGMYRVRARHAGGIVTAPLLITH